MRYIYEFEHDGILTCGSCPLKIYESGNFDLDPFCILTLDSIPNISTRNENCPLVEDPTKGDPLKNGQAVDHNTAENIDADELEKGGKPSGVAKKKRK